MIKTLRIIYSQESTMDMIIIKEFFNYIGISAYGVKVNSLKVLIEEVDNYRNNCDVNIFLNCNNELGSIYSATEFNDLFQYCLKTPIIVNTSLNQRKSKSFFIIYPNKKEQNNLYFKGSNYYRNFLSQIIDTIFENNRDYLSETKNNMKVQMKKILDLMIEHNIFAFLEYMYTFDLIINSSNDNYISNTYLSISDEGEGAFNKLMLRELIAFNNDLGDKEKLFSQDYLLYAKANTIYKIRKILNLIPKKERILLNIDGIRDIEEISKDEHLDLINDIIKEYIMSDSIRLEPLLLGAHIAEQHHTLAGNIDEFYFLIMCRYLRYHKEHCPNPVFFSNAFYHYGAYLNRFMHNYDFAASCFYKAIENDKRNYKANFQYGIYFLTRKKQIRAACEYIEKSLDILKYNNYYNNIFDNLYTEEIVSYIKCLMIMANINTNNVYRNQLQDAIDAYLCLVDKIKNNYCLQNDLDSKNVFYEQWKEANSSRFNAENIRAFIRKLY